MSDIVVVEETTEGETETEITEHSCPHCEDISHMKEAIEKLAASQIEEASVSEDAALEALGELFGVSDAD